MANQADFKIKKGLQIQGGDINFSKDNAATISVDTSTDTNAAGQGLTITTGRGNGSGDGGSLTLAVPGADGAAAANRLVINHLRDMTVSDGAYDFVIASHDDGTNGLKLGSTLVTASGTELNLLDGITTLSGSNTGDEVAASTTTAGVIELATNAETNTGSDSSRAVTPSALTAWTGDTALVTLGTIGTGTWEGTDVGVAYGGTGVSTLTDGGILIGSGGSAITAMAVLADGEMIVGDGTTDPVAESGATLRTSIGVGPTAGNTSLVTTGTIATGTWNATVIASAKLDADTAHLTTAQSFTGAKTFTAKTLMDLDAGDYTSTDAGTDGTHLHIEGGVAMDDQRATGTTANWSMVSLEAPTLTAENTVTTTDAATLYVTAGPTGSSGMTVTHNPAILLTGNLKFNGNRDIIFPDGSATALEFKDSANNMFITMDTTNNQVSFGMNDTGGAATRTKMTIGKGVNSDTELVFNTDDDDWTIGVQDSNSTLSLVSGGSMDAGTAGLTMDTSANITKIGVDSPSDGDVLTYTTTGTNRWKSASASSAAISTSANNGASSATDNTILYYNGTVNTSVQSSANLVFNDSNLSIGSTGKIEFNGAGSGEHIYSSTADQLDIDATTKIEFNTQQIDFISATQNRPVWGLTNDYDGAGGPTMEFKNLKSAEVGEANDILGHITFTGMDTAGTPAEAQHGSIKVEIDVPTAGSESGTMRLGVATGNDGTVKDIIVMTGGEAGSDDSVTTIKGDLTVEGTTTTVNQTEIDVTSALVFDGANAGSHKTTLSVTEPTGTRTIALPDADGTLTVAGGTGLTLTSGGSMSVDASQGQITTVGALAAGSIASGFGTISTGNSITTTGAITGGTVTSESLHVEGTGLGSGEGVKFEARHTAFSSVGTGTATEIYSWVASDYRSGKFLVQMSTGTETEISEVLVTNQNIGSANSMATGDFYYTVYGALDTGTALMGALTFTVVSGSGTDTVTMKMNPLATFTGTVKVLATLIWED